MIPFVILAIEDESSRDFMIRFYESSVKRMYCEARKYFSHAEDVEDVVSDAVVKLVDKIDLLLEIDERRRLAYAVTTVRHLALHALPRKDRFQTVNFDVLEEQLPSLDGSFPEEKLLREQCNVRLQELFHALSTDDRLILEEKYILQWSDAEIAKALGIQPDSVRMRITRAKHRVAKALTEQGFLLSEWV